MWKKWNLTCTINFQVDYISECEENMREHFHGFGYWKVLKEKTKCTKGKGNDY